MYTWMLKCLIYLSIKMSLPTWGGVEYLYKNKNSVEVCQTFCLVRCKISLVPIRMSIKGKVTFFPFPVRINCYMFAWLPLQLMVPVGNVTFPPY